MKRTDEEAYRSSGIQKDTRHKGIRQKVLLSFGLFVAFLILLLWLFQIVLLDDFYRLYKTRQISRTAETLIQNLSQDADTLSELASQLAEHNDLCILLLNEHLDVLLSVEGTRNCLIHRISSRALSWWTQKAREDGQPTTELFQTEPVAIGPVGALLEDPVPETLGELSGSSPETLDTSSGSPAPESTGQSGGMERRSRRFPFARDVQSLLYTRRLTLSDGTAATLLLNSQINPVQSTVQALRFQLLVITVIVSLTAVLLAVIISSRLSRPIIETSVRARALSRARYEPAPHASAYREIAELNETLVRAADDLGQVDRLQQELIANISHDLRTPLTMIGGYAEIMRDIPAENTPENMQIIMDETARLSSLVNELLDFSRMKAGAATLSLQDFCLTQSVSTIIDRVRALTVRDGYVISFEHDAYLTVHADEKRIEQVVYNLLGNALTYTGESRRASVVQKMHDGFARVEIRDEGRGIPEDEIPLIWNRYYRSGETHRRAVIGSGLGLNIVQTILEQHHVPYGVESKEGSGTTFWFELPLASTPDRC